MEGTKVTWKQGDKEIMAVKVDFPTAMEPSRFLELMVETLHDEGLQPVALIASNAVLAPVKSRLGAGLDPSTSDFSITIQSSRFSLHEDHRCKDVLYLIYEVRPQVESEYFSGLSSLP